MCWLKKQFSFLVDVAGKRNHGEEKEEPNKQFQVYTYYTYRVSVIQNYSHLLLIVGLLLVNLKLQYLHPPGNLQAFVCCSWRGGGGIWILPGWGWEFKLVEYTRNLKVRHPLACMSTWHKNCSHCKLTSFKTISLWKIPRVHILYRYFDDFCDRKKIII